MFALTRLLGQLVMPLPAGLLLGLFGLLLPDPTLSRSVVALALLLIWLASTPVVGRWLTMRQSGAVRLTDPAGLGRADVVVVPSGGFPHRELFALELFHLGKAPVVVFSGRRDPDGTRRLAEICGVANLPAEQTVVETDSRTTAEGGRAFQALARSHGWRSALLVSGDYHLARALHHYRGPQLEVIPVSCPEPGLPEPDAIWSRRPLDQKLHDFLPHPDGLMYSNRVVRGWLRRPFPLG
jgi:uncharacterized SAM-binding protein YcdF (DUF218 family)